MKARDFLAVPLLFIAMWIDKLAIIIGGEFTSNMYLGEIVMQYKKINRYKR